MPNGAELEAKIIDAIYRGCCEPGEFERAVELIRQRFDTAGAILFEIVPGAPEPQFTIGAGAIDAAFLEGYARCTEPDPAPARFAAMPTGTVSTTNRVFSAEFLRTNVFLNEFLRPYGMGETLGAPLSLNSGRFSLVGILRAVGRKQFEDDDIAALQRITPHLTRALQIRRLLSQNEWRGHVLETIVNRNSSGMIAINGDGLPVLVNDAARTIAAAGDGIGLDRQGRLLTKDGAAARRLVVLQSNVQQGGAGGLVRIHRPSGRAPYLVLVSPLPARDDRLINGGTGVLFVIHDPSRRVVSLVKLIADVLHVPLGAAKVIGAILDGVELKDYAEREGISANTVKFHLKTAFGRTETRSQTDLVRRTLLALNELGPHLTVK
jgi:PAS domain-containing protein